MLINIDLSEMSVQRGRLYRIRFQGGTMYSCPHSLHALNKRHNALTSQVYYAGRNEWLGEDLAAVKFRDLPTLLGSTSGYR